MPIAPCRSMSFRGRIANALTFALTLYTRMRHPSSRAGSQGPAPHASPSSYSVRPAPTQQHKSCRELLEPGTAFGAPRECVGTPLHMSSVAREAFHPAGPLRAVSCISTLTRSYQLTAAPASCIPPGWTCAAVLITQRLNRSKRCARQNDNDK